MIPALLALLVALAWGLDVAYALLLLGQGDPLTLLCAGFGVGVATLLPAALGHPSPERHARTITVGGRCAVLVGLLLLTIGLVL